MVLWEPASSFPPRFLLQVPVLTSLSAGLWCVSWNKPFLGKVATGHSVLSQRQRWGWCNGLPGDPYSIISGRYGCYFYTAVTRSGRKISMAVELIDGALVVWVRAAPEEHTYSLRNHLSQSRVRWEGFFIFSGRFSSSGFRVGRTPKGQKMPRAFGQWESIPTRLLSRMLTGSMKPGADLSVHYRRKGLSRLNPLLRDWNRDTQHCLDPW